MPGVAEVVTRPAVSPTATGAYNGDETIAQTGQTLTLSLTKAADLTVAACQSAPAYTVVDNEALNLTITKTAGLITVQFSLDVAATVTPASGSSGPFNATLDITGDLTVNPATGCYTSCQVSCGGKSYDTSHTATQSHGAVDITDADTAFAFNGTGADGLGDLIIANNQVTSPYTFAEAPDAHSAAAGAQTLAAAAHALETAFPIHYGDPGQGIDAGDAEVLTAMAQAALTQIANPSDQAAAVAAVLHATAEGAELAVDDGLAAYGVVSHPPPGAVLLA